jgi:hypothetical protein
MVCTLPLMCCTRQLLQVWAAGFGVPVLTGLGKQSRGFWSSKRLHNGVFVFMACSPCTTGNLIKSDHSAHRLRVVFVAQHTEPIWASISRWKRLPLNSTWVVFGLRVQHAVSVVQLPKPVEAKPCHQWWIVLVWRRVRLNSSNQEVRVFVFLRVFTWGGGRL